MGEQGLGGLAHSVTPKVNINQAAHLSAGGTLWSSGLL